MKFRPQRPLPAGNSRNAWEFINSFPPETSVQDLLNPDMWAHVARQWFRPLDEVVVIPQSAPFKATFIVMDKGDAWAKLRLLDVTMLNAVEEKGADPEPASVTVKWNGPRDKFTVLRTSDREKLKTGFAIKAEAEAWAREHALAMA